VAVLASRRTDVRVPGRLSLSGSPSVELSEPLTSSLRLVNRTGSGDTTLSQWQSAPIGPEEEHLLVHGEVHSPPEAVTLANCFTRERGDGRLLQAAYALTGGHVAEDLEITSARAQLGNLQQWANLGGLETRLTSSGDAGATFKRPESSYVIVPEIGARVGLEAVARRSATGQAFRSPVLSRTSQLTASARWAWGRCWRPRRALSSQTLTSRSRSATAGRQVRARESPPEAGHAATGTQVALRPRPRLPARQHVRP
jgi:hypothetical protein